MFLLQKRRKAALSWSLFDSDMVRLSRPACETERLRLSERREEARSVAARLSLKVALTIKFVIYSPMHNRFCFYGTHFD